MKSWHILLLFSKFQKEDLWYISHTESLKAEENSLHDKTWLMTDHLKRLGHIFLKTVMMDAILDYLNKREICQKQFYFNLMMYNIV